MEQTNEQQRSPQIMWNTIILHLIFVLRHPPRHSPSVAAPSTTSSSSSRAALPPHPAISKWHCSGEFSMFLHSRSCSVAPPRALTWIYVAWASRHFTRSCRRRVTPYLSDEKTIFEVLGSVCRPAPTPLRISLRPSPVRLLDVRRRSVTCRRRAILRRSRLRSNV